jgi:RsiW-degrading membrane proteinase PrsW (M82 family)
LEDIGLSGSVSFYLRGLGFIIGGVLFWLIYFDLKDRYKPEPRKMLIWAFFLGNCAAVLAVALYVITRWVGLPTYAVLKQSNILLYCFLMVGPIEEGTKFFVTRVFIFPSKYFDERIDGIVYASAVAIGFASLESIIHMPYLNWYQQLARALTSPLTHSLFAAVWGFGVSRAFFSARTRTDRILWQVLPLLISMFLHGLYDYFLLAYNATFLASGVALILWVLLIIYARRVVRSQKPIRIA